MSASGNTIVKNAGVMMASQLVTWATTLVLTIFLPRYLGAARSGELYIAGSIWALAGVLIAFGTDTLIVKEVARDHAKAPSLLATVFVLRGLLYLLCCALVAAYVYLVGFPATTVHIVAIGGVAQLLFLFSGACNATWQGLEKMEYVSLSAIVGKALNAALGITIVALGFGLYAVASIGVVVAAFDLLLQAFLMRQRYTARLHVDPGWLLATLKTSAPYLMSGLMLTAYSQVDVLVMSWLLDARAIGWYSAATRLYGTTLFIPVVFTTSLFPALARAHAGDRPAHSRLLGKSFTWMLLISVPIGLGLMVIAQPLVVLLYGPDFAQSGPVLAVLGIVLIFMYQTILIGQFLISADRQNVWTVVMLVATAATLGLDLALIPWCQRVFGNGAIGGAISFAITELGMVLAGLALLPKGTLVRASAWAAARVLFAGLAMAAVVWWWREAFIAVPIGIGVLTYASLIAATRVIPREDVALLLSLARRLVGGRSRRVAGLSSPKGVDSDVAIS